MKLQANLFGAWRNVLMLPTTDESGPPEDELLKHMSNHLCDMTHGRRIVDAGKVLWVWSPEKGWYRPRWLVNKS